ncbi:MAG TPA: AraC family transcriptional regulator [Gammaproteobacteria bacterium]|nr:AraC family transcriptional regulator [Gammaproteobacteria bacterium]
METEPSILLWVDKRTCKSEFKLSDFLKKQFKLHHVQNNNEITHAIQQTSSTIIFFDYDYPHKTGLDALRLTKQDFPSIPIIMLTKFHSEALAVWAFRARVLDYIVKPIKERDLVSSINKFTRQHAGERNNNKPRYIYSKCNPLPVETRVTVTENRKTTFPAISYIAAHMHERISLDAASRLCNLNPYAFSRAFKRENGMNFQTYLIQKRIEKAAVLLQHPGYNITDVAISVGFNSSSYFSQMFRRHMKITPKEYKNKNFPDKQDNV